MVEIPVVDPYRVAIVVRAMVLPILLLDDEDVLPEFSVPLDDIDSEVLDEEVALVESNPKR